MAGLIELPRKRARKEAPNEFLKQAGQKPAQTTESAWIDREEEREHPVFDCA
jgi:hypothetical protein